MGVMRFRVSPPGFLASWPEAERAFMSGFDGRVFPTDVDRDGDLLVCRRASADSGRLNVAWPVLGFGRTLVSTSSLREQEDSYLLPLELARGRIGQLRNQLAAWEIAGMVVPSGYDEASRQAHQIFGRATSVQDDEEEACRLSEAALVHALNAAQILAREYIRQRLQVRSRRSDRFPAMLGCGLTGSVPPPWDALPAGVFNAVTIPLDWRRIEANQGEPTWDEADGLVDWALDQNLVVHGGPLLDFGPNGLPGWLDAWIQDADNLQSFVCDFTETVVSRYVGRVRTWELASRVNTGGALGLPEEGRLALLSRAAQVVREVGDVEQLLVRIEQPWGSYQSSGNHVLSPLQFIDGLVRSAPGVTGVALELTAGFAQSDPGRRDLLDLSRLLDIWSTLGLPLHVTMAAPSSGGQDSGGRFVRPDAADQHPGSGTDESSMNSEWTEMLQSEWVDAVMPLLLAKQSVASITWPHLDDSWTPQFPTSGLLDHQGSPRAVVETIRRHRFSHWPAR